MNKSVWLILYFFLSFFSFSQTNSDSIDNNLRVGVVLSGGGAKGMAHVGALKVLEQSGVRIDYIAGTSMGAIVGGLYASGYSSDELTEIFRQVDFDELIRDDFSRSIKNPLERADADKRAVTLPFNNFKLSFPSALSKGQNIYNNYVKLLQHVKDESDFSKLPIPFFCVATDAETGKQVILDQGYLPDAIAASGAIPSLFEPVLLNDKLLIDGGVSNNYPIEELLEKKVDVIIGVDVQDSLRTKQNLKSISDVMIQVSNFSTQQNMAQKIAKTDIYIKPDISNFSVVSFDEAESIYKSGLDAALKVKEDLVRISKQQKNVERQKVKKILEKDYYLNDIVIKGNQNYTDAYVLGKLKIKTPSLVASSKVDEGIKSLASTNNFHAVKFKISRDSTLRINLGETNNNTVLKLGVHYDNLYRSAALINITRKQLLTKNDIASLDFILGDNIRYNFDYYLDKGFYWSIGLRSYFNTFDRNINLRIFDNNTPSNLDFNVELEALELVNQFYLETLIKKNLSLALGIEHKRLKLYYEDSGSNIDLEDDNFFSTFGMLKFDSLDDKYFPSKGVYFDGDFHLYFYSNKLRQDFTQFSIAKANMGFSKPLRSNLSLNVFSQGGIRIGNNETPSFDFVLGGFGNYFLNNYKSFYGYDFLSLAGDSYVKADVSLNWQFIKNNYLIASANYANIDDGLFKDSDWLSLPEYSGYAIGYGLKTLLGPMQVKSSWSPDVKKINWYVSLGYWF